MRDTVDVSAPFLFDPTHSETVRAPDVAAGGHWVGAPSACSLDGVAYLSYRRRRPRGEGRGYLTCLASSDGGPDLIDRWQVEKERFATSSVERCALAEGGDGIVWYVSYVDPSDNRWCVDAVTARRADELPAAIDRRRPVLRAGQLGLEAVKDPVLLRCAGLYLLYVSVARRRPDYGLPEADLHAGGDAYTTGGIVSDTGLAVSRDGLAFEWVGTVLQPAPGHWDGYLARITVFLELAGTRLALYDGSAGAAENYEERSGVALASDPGRLCRLSADGPWIVSPEGSGSLRYVTLLERDGSSEAYYELARADGSHELRRSPLAASAGAPACSTPG